LTSGRATHVEVNNGALEKLEYFEPSAEDDGVALELEARTYTLEQLESASEIVPIDNMPRAWQIELSSGAVDIIKVVNLTYF